VARISIPHAILLPPSIRGEADRRSKSKSIMLSSMKMEDGMTKENTQKESIFKNSSYGFASLVMLILWLVFLYVVLGRSSSDSSLLDYLVFVSPIVGAIFAVIGLFADAKKGFSIAGLILFLCIAGLLLYLLYIFTHTHWFVIFG
jgi:hypothetical protein